MQRGYPTARLLGLALLFLMAYVSLVLVGTAAVVLRIVRPSRETFAVALGKGLPTDPSELELSAEEVTFHLPDKHITPGWIIKGDRPDGPTVLLLHGHGGSIYSSLRFAEHLVRYAGHVVVFDWPAHGGCSANWMTCGMREPSDAIAVLDGLPQPLRDRPVVLFGYSLGGQIAIKTAAEFPRFAGVIVDGAYRRWDTPVRLRMKRWSMPRVPIVQLVGGLFGLTGLIKGFDRAEYAKRIAVPMLLLHGTEDRICPIDEGRELAEAAPDARFVAIEGGWHNRLFDHDAKTYHEALADFFASVAADKQGGR